MLLLRRDRCPVGEEGAALGQVGGVRPAAAAAVVRDRVVEEAPAVVQVLQRGLRWRDAGYRGRRLNIYNTRFRHSYKAKE